MMINERLSTVKRLRWTLRQVSRISKLLGISNAASMHCPYCKTKVHVGDFFCCSDLERAWQMTEKSSNTPVLAENHFEPVGLERKQANPVVAGWFHVI